uniref:C2H2-type domain-containing protein n=1 Tax=Branchiostoma floridae TaxID=7739 RepID=C3XZW6_BRAFL|eukprot:XP_002610322.1 hypothetical protein BRAFLDRAFT_84035 [Branchiostoma floridae]
MDFLENGAWSIEVWGHRSAGFDSTKPGWEVDHVSQKAKSLSDRLQPGIGAKDEQTKARTEIKTVSPIPTLKTSFRKFLTSSQSTSTKHPAINGHIAYKPPLCFMYELCPPGRPACRFAPSHGFHDHGPPPPLLIGPALPKRPRLGPPLAVAMRRSQSRVMRHTNMSNDGDILICGRCKRLFSNIHRLQHHKLVGCRPHVTCGCRKKDLKVDDFAVDQPPASLSCAECGQPCSSPWDLLQHASLQHDNTIYLQDQEQEGEGGMGTLVGDADGSEGKASLEMESDVTSSVSGESTDEQMNSFVTDLKLETGR